MKNSIAVTILSVLTVLSLLLSVKGSAQEIVWDMRVSDEDKEYTYVIELE